MKKVLSIIVAIFMITMLLGACKSEDTAPTESASTTENTSSDKSEEPAKTDDKPLKVMLIARQLSDPFSNWLMEMAKNHLDADYPEVEYNLVDQQADPANSQMLFDQAVLEQYDAIVFQKVSASQNADNMLQEAYDAGIRVCIVNNPSTDHVTSASYVPDYTLGTLAAEYAAEHLPDNARVVFYLGPPGASSSGDRVQAFRDTLFSKRTDVEILDEQNVDLWSKDTAMGIMEDWCQRFPEIDAVLSVNDGMALGGIEALKADGRDISNMLITGIDGLADGCLSIKDGELKVTVLQDAKDMAEHGVDIAIKMAKGEIEGQEIYEVTPVVIDSDNVEEYIKMHRENGLIS